MTLGTTTQAYGEPSYWDNRYTQDPGPFDWYQKYPALSPLLHLYVPLHNRVLVIGCGNAAISEDMANDGFEDIVNIDISSVVIEAMQTKYQDIPALKYIQMDVRDMSGFESGSFDAVLDKGTLDSIMCGHNSQDNASKMLEEVGRVLKDNGVYILITYGAPAYRLPTLKKLSLWTIKLHVVEKPMADGNSEQIKWELTNPVSLDESGSSVETALGRTPEVHFIYVCTKDESLQSSSSKQEIEF
ncbi:EEF1A lysine methyltransferase 4-like [Papaver somniferum]|uniref:EEF1A lysine methyltransferase 4-like n=1 Tax=Papaver somniferum TaxID=3469 RepID=UPI000E6F9706|nr:EEF1A lysine methyltransferase 4-like [Papaver somniferum]